jgi:hypothetical protein
MSLITRQDALVAQLQPVHAKRIRLGAGGWWAGTRSRFKNAHIAEMVAAGYSRREAAESAQQCDEMAQLNADHDALIAQMGAAS